MRKNLIAMSVSALVAGFGLAGGAAANVLVDTSTGSATNATAEFNSVGGIGHQLIVPYFTTQAGNATLINIINTDTVNGKAVKIRFRGAANSDDVFDFQLYMSPGDKWSANISQGASGFSQLLTTDRSCTIPPTVNASFTAGRLQPSLSAEGKAAGTREGYVEIFNMADIAPQYASTATLTGTNALYTAIKHKNGVADCTVSVLNDLAFDPTSEAEAHNKGFQAPTTGLFANFTIINVGQSGAETGEATSVQAQDALGVAARGNIVFSPQTPDVVGGGGDPFTADPLFRTSSGPALPVLFDDLPDFSTPYLLGNVGNPIAQAEAHTRALATTSVTNEYLTDPTIAAKTDWVFSMPTRRYSVALDYSKSPVARVFTTFPTRDYFTAANTSVTTVNGASLICTNTSGVTFFGNEEETLQGSNFVISPNPAQASFALCGEVSVLTFNAPGSVVLGSTVANTSFSTSTFNGGWAVVSTPGLATGNGGTAPSGTTTGNGLPILGKAYVRATDPQVSAGIAANFGGSWEHRNTRPNPQ